MWELARSWVEGWAVSRGTPRPVDEPWGLSIQVGLPDQPVRHVLLDTDAGTARGLVDAITEPAVCLKGFLEPAVMEPWFSPAWEPIDPGFLMATDLRTSAARTPDGYTVDGVRTADGVVSVRVRAAGGEPAASGRAGLTGTACVFDQIVTEEAHRRRGLGTVVMGALTGAALENGAVTGLLGATVQGRALYETLDWKVHAPLTGFTHRPVAG